MIVGSLLAACAQHKVSV